MPTVASGVLVSPGGQQGVPGPVGGGGISALLSLTSAYTLTAADSGKYVICTGGSWTLGLSGPSQGMNYYVRNDQGITGTTGTITIQPTSGLIDGGVSLSLLAGQEVRLLTDGTNWRSVGRQRNPVLGTQDISSATASNFFLLPPGYRYYELNFEAIVGSVDASYLTINLSSDGGATWRTDTSYVLDQIYPSSTTAVANAYSTTAAGQISVDATYSANSAAISAGTYIKFWPGNGTRFPHWKFEAWGYQSTVGVIRGYLAGAMYGVAVIANAIRYQMASGNIMNSQLTVKGII